MVLINHQEFVRLLTEEVHMNVNAEGKSKPTSKGAKSLTSMNDIVPSPAGSSLF